MCVCVHVCASMSVCCVCVYEIIMHVCNGTNVTTDSC